MTVTIASGITADDKVYDGATSATISSNNVVLNGVLPADTGQVDLSTNEYTATFVSADVGSPHCGDRGRAEPDRGQGGGLRADAAGGIDGGDWKGGGDDHFGHHGRQQGV